METFFRYNWMVREQWYVWCEDVPLEELLRPRMGGVGNILQTLFHIIDVEWSWLQLLQDKPDDAEDFANYQNLEAVRRLDRKLRPDVEALLQHGIRVWKKELLLIIAQLARSVHIHGEK